MRFTIVTPLYNGMPWLPECVASIDAQRADVDVEHIVYDAGSSDGSREWLEQNAKQATLVFERDRGQIDALEKGFARASGDVLGWLNGDDVLEPRALARVRAAFAGDERAALVTGACLFIDAAGIPLEVCVPPVRADLDTLLKRTMGLAQPSTFFRASAWRRVGALDAALGLAFDNDLFRKLAREGAVITLPAEVLSRFRVHGGSKTEQNHAQSAREDLLSRRRMGLPLTSGAALTLAKRGYVYPLVPKPAMRAAKSFVRALRGT